MLGEGYLSMSEPVVWASSEDPEPEFPATIKLLFKALALYFSDAILFIACK